MDVMSETVGAPSEAFPAASEAFPAASEAFPAASEAFPAASEEFLTSFEALAQAVRRARGAVASDRAGRLTPSQYALLLPLCDSDTARVSDLAAQAAIAPSTASRILDALERRKLVRRARSAEDRRAVIVTLTDAGRRSLSDQHEWIRGRKLTFYDQLPPAERELVSDLLVRLAALIDDLSAGPDD
jgi:DNA-binding MarR family transcriptional regulator